MSDLTTKIQRENQIQSLARELLVAGFGGCLAHGGGIDGLPEHTLRGVIADAFWIAEAFCAECDTRNASASGGATR